MYNKIHTLEMYCSVILKNIFIAGHQWLKTIILATQEAEIRRSAVQSQSRQIACKTLSQKNPSQKKGLVEWLNV
jgi:hypothetical protein